MTRTITLIARTAALAVIAAVSTVGGTSDAEARGSRTAHTQMRAAQAQAMKMKMMQAQRAQAGMAAAMVTAATLAATDAGECSPYLAKWMMTKSLAAKAAYDACMED